jgi:peptide deformylase
MAILKVARMGHPVLRTRARAIDVGEVRSPRIQQLIDDMFETMTEYQGVGLAAPQVHVSVRLFVAGFAPAPGDEDDEMERVPLMALVNPEIMPVSEAMVEDWEGCLSIPDIRGKVPRAREVVIKALDRRGKPFEQALKNYPARVVQHETDHLDGVLFFDRMKAFDTLTFMEEFQRYWTPQE